MYAATGWKAGAELMVGDNIDVGIKQRIGKITGFLPHPQLAERNPGVTGRVAVTDRGNITVIDREQISTY